VKGTSVTLDTLVMEILSHQYRNNIDEVLPFSVFNSNNSEQSTTELNGQFINSQLLINCLLSLKSTSEEFDELITLVRNEYKNNRPVLELIREFEQEYTRERAIWWYTRDSFLYRMLNKALRVQNIDLLYLLRFIIQDLCQQLDEYQYSSSIRVYRGQLILNDELNTLRNSIGELVSMNTFLSTSVDRDLALFFLGSSEELDNDLQRVLFEIDANPQINGTKPFADITRHSFMMDEQEVLFMLGAIFRINTIRHIEDDQIWIIHMTLCNHNDQDLKSVIEQLEYEVEADDKSLFSFGALLHRTGKLNESEKYFHRLLSVLPENDSKAIYSCYHNLGMIAMDKEDYDLSLHWHQKSLEIMINILESNDLDLADSYNCIGCVCDCKKDYERAIEFYKKALMIFERSLGEDNRDIALCFNNMGITYGKENKLLEALDCHQKALALYNKHLVPCHPDLGQSHKNIAVIYCQLGNYDLALEHYLRTLNIYEKSLPPHCPDIARLLLDIGDVYMRIHKFQQAISYYEKAAIIFRKTFPSANEMINRIDERIQQLSLLIR
ncbi:unnamed protein product, partial [Rotaria sp. Silwood2]